MWWIIGIGLAGLFIFFLWSMLALGDRKDKETDKAFVEMIKAKDIGNTITSGCPVENNKYPN